MAPGSGPGPRPRAQGPGPGPRPRAPAPAPGPGPEPARAQPRAGPLPGLALGHAATGANDRGGHGIKDAMTAGAVPSFDDRCRLLTRGTEVAGGPETQGGKSWGWCNFLARPPPGVFNFLDRLPRSPGGV